ncbi:aquaporin [Bifidobacterium sp. ESL0800]|uniref:MIP/aquaporin family protein n=1 Tax=Bifidobacterium sp. ESL0800 TaxID=2983236 RepID=UPI0023FA02A1|nr:aquaporin [Bifidobacterium sp. ESL0800]WEV76142.1 aquaporin [Bifidobacterium sp. ESL0800]
MTEQQAQHTENKTSPVISISGICSELVGSFLIFIAIYLVSALSPSLYGPSAILVAAATGLAYAAMTFVFGRFSGGQFNPAVTLAAMLVSKIGIVNGICYIVAQVVGAIAAGGVAKLVLPTSKAAPARMWFANAVNGYDQGSISATQLQQAGVSFGILFAVVVEVIATIIVVAASLRAIDDDGKATSNAAAIMGVAYALGVTFTYPVTGSSLNPARATGIAIFANNAGLATHPLQQLWIFWICPILAAAIVAIVVIIAQMISSKNSEDAEALDVTADWEQEDAQSENGSADDDESADAEKSDDFQMPSLTESEIPSETTDEPKPENDATVESPQNEESQTDTDKD